MKAKPASVAAPDNAERLLRFGGSPWGSRVCMPELLGGNRSPGSLGREPSQVGHAGAACAGSPRLGAVGPAGSQGPRELRLALCRSPAPPTLQMPPQAEAPVLSPHSLPARTVSSPKTSSHPPPADKASPTNLQGHCPRWKAMGQGFEPSLAGSRFSADHYCPTAWGNPGAWGGRPGGQ